MCWLKISPKHYTSISVYEWAFHPLFNIILKHIPCMAKPERGRKKLCINGLSIQYHKQNFLVSGISLYRASPVLTVIPKLHPCMARPKGCWKKHIAPLYINIQSWSFIRNSHNSIKVSAVEPSPSSIPSNPPLPGWKIPYNTWTAPSLHEYTYIKVQKHQLHA